MPIWPKVQYWAVINPTYLLTWSFTHFPTTTADFKFLTKIMHFLKFKVNFGGQKLITLFENGFFWRIEKSVLFFIGITKYKSIELAIFYKWMSIFKSFPFAFKTGPSITSELFMSDTYKSRNTIQEHKHYLKKYTNFAYSGKKQKKV